MNPVAEFLTWLDLPYLTLHFVDNLVDDFAFHPWTYPPLIAILVLERLRPARPDQRPFSPAVCVDVLWLLLAIPLGVFVVSVYVRGLHWLFHHPLSSLRIDLGDHLPFFALVAVSFVVGDFLSWVHHYVRHKVPLFWRFHAVHHSQREMNLFADARVHLFEFFVDRVIVFLPFFVLGGNASLTVAALVLVQTWYARFYHSNVRINLGPLRHVLVTPQSHRVHHSVEERHTDKNFGNFLTIWDRLFGTLVTDYDDYPETGIADAGFPEPTSRAPAALLRGYWAQFAYPFRPAGTVTAAAPAPGA